MVYVIIGFFVFVLIREILKRVLQRSAGANQYADFISKKMKKMRYKVIIVRFLLEGCVELGLTAMISVIIFVNPSYKRTAAHH